MRRERFALKKINKYKTLKKGIVLRKGWIVYKIDESTMFMVEKMEELLDGSNITDFIAMPVSELYDEDHHFIGFTLRYEKNLKVVKYANITDKQLNSFMFKLLEIIDKLNSLGICFWDIHDGNVKLKNNKPFLIDVDSSDFEPSYETLQIQRRNLCEYILNTYLCTNYDLSFFIHNFDLKDIFSEEVYNYILDCLIIKFEEQELPYQLIKELNDRSVVMKLKKQIK